MNISCNIISDLLPLYIDGCCSENSREAVEAHLKGCPDCRSRLQRMKNPEPDTKVEIAEADVTLDGCVKKLKRHRIKTALSVTAAAILGAALLCLIILTVQDMRRNMSPNVYEVEEGIYNLTANKLECTSEDVENYVFFTNYKQISVEIQTDTLQNGSVTLWDAADDSDYIQIHMVTDKSDTCTFENLSAHRRYRIKCDGLAGARLTVSEGRNVSFWGSLKSVLIELLGG